jgi:xanthine dehydrogenase YagR molybdenum-binding subunit
MYALECAMDELALALEMDPVELRIANEPDVDPETGEAFTSRNLVACLRRGAERFGWAERDHRRGTRDGRWLVGTGVASATYPAMQQPSKASARALPDGTFVVRVAAADIGTGARTALTQLAADALGTDVERVHVGIGDSAFPKAPVAGGSAGTNSWGSAVHKACTQLREALDQHERALPAYGLEVTADTEGDLSDKSDSARHAFGAHFCEVRVDGDSGEVRVSRMLGVFAAGRIVNPLTARSQFIGGMTMGIGMALLEESALDLEFGDYLNHDLAQYHVPANADVADIEAEWLDERDDEVNPIGTKGIGEIGIVGSAAAIVNAVHHATGKRIRDLPVHLDDLVGVGRR